MAAGTGMTTLISEQLQELMEAKSTGSDYKIAFNLQLQEAITASFAFSSSLSSSPSSSSLHEEQKDSTHISDIMIEEIERFKQKRSDYEQCQSEEKRIKRDLNLRLHDHHSASKILRISDEQWKCNGDDFQKPYESVKKDDELFRLYFKGIVVGELAAIGVAIYDSKDNLVFELSKPVNLERDKRREMVEVEGLIEGLNAALDLDLKRVVYYCDDFLLHQYH